MDVRIGNGIIGLFPGTCLAMTRIHSGRAEIPAQHGGAVLAGVFGSNDVRRHQASKAGAAPVTWSVRRLRIGRLSAKSAIKLV